MQPVTYREPKSLQKTLVVLFPLQQEGREGQRQKEKEEEEEEMS